MPKENSFSDRFTVRPFSREDCPEAAEIERLCFSDPWSEKSLEYLCQSPVTQGFACVDKSTGKLAAYVGLEFVLDEGDIINVATHPDYRRLGCATELLKVLLDFAEEKGVNKLSLEVRASNLSAVSLYKTFGFEEIGLMPNYYSKPTENAIVMAYERKNS